MYILKIKNKNNKNMKIYDCFMFSDENMILLIRLNELNKYIDKFIITEAAYTHDGSPKKLNFDINNFREFKKKIEYVVVKNQPENLIKENIDDSKSVKSEKKIINSLRRENYQRNQILQGINQADQEDLIIVSDLDEIPNLEGIMFQKIKNEILIFKQKMFYYKFNLHYPNFTWFGPKATKKKNLISPQWLRNIKNKKYSFLRLDTLWSDNKYMNIRFIENGGWHFTCIKKPEDVKKKLSTFLHHQDFEDSKVSLDDLKKKMREKKVLYDHSLDKKNQNKWDTDIELKKIDKNYLPNFINENFHKYLEWVEN